MKRVLFLGFLLLTSAFGDVFVKMTESEYENYIKIKSKEKGQITSSHIVNSNGNSIVIFFNKEKRIVAEVFDSRDGASNMRKWQYLDLENEDKGKVYKAKISNQKKMIMGEDIELYRSKLKKGKAHEK